MKDSSDDRSALAHAMVWTSRITTISMEMVVPGLVGLWVDRQLGTGPWLLIVGVIIGFFVGMWQLVKLGETTHGDHPSPEEDEQDQAP